MSRVYLPILWLVVVGAGFLVYGASGHDDAHIGFWFAHTLLERGEMVNYNGDRVDQATNLLLVFATALFAKLLSLGIVTSGYLVDLLASLACCGLLTWLARKICPALVLWPALLALSCVSFLVWVFGGMGSMLTALCLLAGVAVWWRYVESSQLKPVHYLVLPTITLALVLVRPEMPLVVPVINLYAMVFYWRDVARRQRCLQILLVSCLGCALLIAWQKYYFSSWPPVPVIAKQSGDFRLGFGTLYSLGGSILNPVVGIAFLLSLPLSVQLFLKKPATKVDTGKLEDQEASTRNTLWVFLVAALQVYIGFMWLAGGDWMHAGRFFVPVIPLAALLATSVLFIWVRRIFIVHLFLAVLVLLGFRLQPLLFIDGSSGVPAWTRYRMLPAHTSYSVFEQYNYEHLRDMAVIDHLGEIVPGLYEKLGRPVRLMSGQAGMVFYRLAEKYPDMVYYTDLHGLAEGSLTLCPLLADGGHHDMYGLAWKGYAEFFSMLPALQEKCGIQPPDVIFNMEAFARDTFSVLPESGYVLVHEERGSLIQENNVLPPGKDAVAFNYIFVRADLLSSLREQGKRVIDYSAMPLHKRWGYDWFSSE